MAEKVSTVFSYTGSVEYSFDNVVLNENNSNGAVLYNKSGFQGIDAVPYDGATVTMKADASGTVRDFDPNLRKVGICIDTGHLWSTGINIQRYDEMCNWMKQIEEFIPRDRILIHLNDNNAEFNSNKDKHAALLEGKIWEFLEFF